MNILTTYTLKYLRLNRKRTAVTILGVILSAALICGVFLLGVSFQKVMIDHEIFMAGNWHARFHGVPYEKAKYITDNSAVQTAMLSASLGSATDGSHNTVRPYLYVTAYDALSFQNHSIKLISGRFPQNTEELLISPVMIRDSGLSLKPGSTLQLAFGQRNIPDYDEKVKAWGGEEYVALQDGETFTPSVSKTYTVVGVMAPLPDETGMPAAFPALTYLDPAQLAATDKVDIAILARDPRSISTSAPEMAKSAGLQVSTSPDGQPTKESISYNEDLLPWLGASGRSNYVSSFLLIMTVLIALIVCGSALLIYNAFAISIGERKKQFGMFASVGATSAQIRRIVLIGVTNIVNTLDTNIKLRRREIAMLKSVGLTPGGFLRMLRYESLFYGLTALLYGLPIGIALSFLIYKQFGGVIYFAFTLPWGAIAACVLGILAIVFTTMMVSGAMIRNDNIVDTLKEENL